MLNIFYDFNKTPLINKMRRNRVGCGETSAVKELADICEYPN